MNRFKSAAVRLGVIGAIWIGANMGYYVLFSIVDELSYNEAPISISLYFLGWSVLSIAYLRHTYGARLIAGIKIWRYTLINITLACVMWGLLQLLSSFPSITGPIFAPYSDILLATPWYFLPKATEILLQQTLIAVLVFELSHWLVTLGKISIAYAVSFGGMHIAYALLSDMPTPYAVIITSGALISSVLFPYLILRVRGGIVYAYAAHLLFYIFLVLLFHTWPPPGYSLG